jgi:antitoxin ChpS
LSIASGTLTFDVKSYQNRIIEIRGYPIMMQTLRRAGGSLVMTVPKTFIEQNQLQEGSEVELNVVGMQMTVSALRKPRYKLADLMAEMPTKLPRVHGWDEITDLGKEVA